ncbi:putative SH3 domain [Monocercomonoides exilis]|uniref:putative SH3 domain n=1 Tax=Monocercomonoides exilis TaxID=2049356 RepID=UPI00355AC3A4|nr:putative SH3 domain [Monocercomonoides exilis]|eukprot:MONOS_5808.1-p1 / transcript=MONOS_5808.1 / gene=MONOS_5808 / organism=Monocercomonoides_exilis_PA203 / gene_product=unspecified product / transcript_product=unspecified product / location=Mono_scaffold00174:58859-59654(-) / protein_length=173 / sequence_SO=supercontig / SO=protein_coding / is_pseudo=false
MSGEGPIRLEALFDFQARVPNELTFKEGDVITLLDKHPSGMWKGELAGVVGLFPYNFVKEVGDSDGGVGASKKPAGPKEGWLTKQGHLVKNWKRRWFVLRDGVLYYYGSKSDTKEKGMHDLRGCEVREAREQTQKPYSFNLYYPSDDKKKQLFVYADSMEEMKDWMAAIKSYA